MFEKLIPLVYLLAIGGIVVVFRSFEVSESVTMLLVGAGLTRVRIGEKKKDQNGHSDTIHNTGPVINQPLPKK
jgi:hypothetical protein